MEAGRPSRALASTLDVRRRRSPLYNILESLKRTRHVRLHRSGPPPLPYSALQYSTGSQALQRCRSALPRSPPATQALSPGPASLLPSSTSVRLYTWHLLLARAEASRSAQLHFISPLRHTLQPRPAAGPQPCVSAQKFRHLARIHSEIRPAPPFLRSVSFAHHHLASHGFNPPSSPPTPCPLTALRSCHRVISAAIDNIA